jgi:hypothetical protein
MSPTVSRISRNKAFAWASCLLSRVRLPGGLAYVKAALLVNVFPVTDIIQGKASAFQLARHGSRFTGF